MALWYRTGTVAVTNGSTTITGTGTAFVDAAISAGDAFHAPDGRVYEIASVGGATDLTLVSAYLGSTASAQAYSIQPTRAIVAEWRASAQALVDAYAGYAAGVLAGKFPDGAVGTPSLAFASDADTGWFLQAAGVMAGATGGSLRMRLLSTGAEITGLLSGTAVTQTAVDNTAGRLLKVGDFGLGATTSAPAITDFDTLTTPAGAYAYSGTVLNPPSGLASTGHVIISRQGSDGIMQVAFGAGSAGALWRSATGGVWGNWETLSPNLSAIAASKAVTAVDVFVYDTSKDSDGGAWRMGTRARRSSWYNETLNTATRGARREFPAVAVIVTEAAKVTIYDGDDPALPMWMVFNASGFNAISTSSVTSIAAINGVISVGTDAATGIFALEFLKDRSFRYNSLTATTGYYNGTILGRNATKNFTYGFSLAIVNANVNDIAMAVLPGAPTDPATGLPVPTISVATAGGVSVIASSGAVYDSLKTTACTTVVIDEDGYLRATFSDGGVRVVALSTITADGFDGTTLNSTSQPPTFGAPTKAANRVLGSTSGMAIYSSGLWGSVRISSAFNSGWMPGAIKGAWLASKNTASLVAGTAFSDDGTATTNWTLGAGWAHDAGNTEFDHTATNTATLQLAVSGLTSGAHYAVAVTMANRSAGSVTSAIGSGSTAGMTATGYVYFTASATTATLTITPTSDFDGSIGGAVVSVADADRSVNNKGLTVNGTITRAAVATGAELVGYGGFSAANYLEQPYNSAFDFGTGDFCVMGWAKSKTTTASTQSLLSITDGAGNYLHLGRSSSGGATNPKSLYLNLYGSGAGHISLPSGIVGTDMDAGIWCFVCLTRESGVTKLWFNGVAVVTSSAAYDDFVTPASVLKLGTGFDTTVNEMAMALWRIGATAPSADQIAKIYRDELPLFQENAACTLYGASDAVTALAHDPDTGLLHVGTSAGRSVFSGLSRVANTTTAVATAIAAARDLILEQ